MRRLTRHAAVPPRAVQAVAAIGVRRLAARIGAALRAATGVRKLAATTNIARAGLLTEVPRTAAATASAIADTEAVAAASLTADVGMVRNTMAPEGTAADRGTSVTAGTLITAGTASAARIGVRRTITPRGVDGTSVTGSTAAMLRDTTSVRAVTAAGAPATLIGAAVASATTRMVAVDMAIMASVAAVINNMVGAADTAFITGKGGEVSPALIM